MQNVPKEADEQKALFQWIRLSERIRPELQTCFAIPNGGSRNIVEAHNLRLQGVTPGIPDIFLPVARGDHHGLFIELKRRKGGRVSVDQKRMLAALREQGYEACVCYGWEDAKNAILEYLR